jgi:uncharacterized membrane protein YidH (DUF202 family)
MDTIKIVAILLVLGGGLALAYGGFSYTHDTQAAKIGPVELTVRDTKTVNIPVWAAVVTIVVGASIMLARR